MRFISSKVHGMLDYIVGLLLIAAPWLFGFYRGGAESWVPIVLGAGALVYSIFTRYELGLVKIIPFKVHLALDIASGILLAASPWLFGFSDHVYLPHLLVGLVEIFTPLMTRPYADHVRGSDHVAHGTAGTSTSSHDRI